MRPFEADNDEGAIGHLLKTACFCEPLLVQAGSEALNRRSIFARFPSSSPWCRKRFCRKLKTAVFGQVPSSFWVL